jgi:hypothetical protein
MDSKSNQESSKKNWTDIIKVVTNPLGFAVLLALIIESLVITDKISGSTSPIFQYVGIFLLAVIFFTMIYMGRKHPGVLSGNQVVSDNHNQNDILIEEIKLRGKLYLKAEQVIKNAHSVINDPTFGKPAPELSPTELQARKKYRNAIKAAIKKDKIYHELFSGNLDQVKKDNVADSFRSSKKYQFQCIENVTTNIPVVDFLVNDADEVILSHVVFSGPNPTVKYLYIKSHMINDFYKSVFQECWSENQKVKTGQMQ